MKRLFATLAVFGSVLSLSALAGESWDAPMSIGSNSANGSLGQVRADPNYSTDFIACYTFANTGGPVTAWCLAQNLTSAGSCSTTDPALVSLVETIGSDGYLSFAWNSSGTCTSIFVGHGSPYRPKTP